jgi:hypothetical protein
MIMVMTDDKPSFLTGRTDNCRYLDASLRQVDPQGHLLAQEYIGVVRLLKQRLQFLQLLRSESSSVPAL